MKALRLEAFGHLAVVDLPEPAPDTGEVVIRTAYTGICGSDIHGFTGGNGRRVPGQIMGHESSGTVESVGSQSDEWLVGLPVTFNPFVVPAELRAAYAGREPQAPGGYVIGVRPDHVAAFAQRVVVPASNVVPLPSGVPLELGALAEPLAVGVQAVSKATAGSSSSVLVVGGGPIGQSVVVALRAAGVERIAVSEISSARRALLDSLDVLALDPTDAPVADQLAGRWGERPDVAFDCVGTSTTLSDALTSLATGGCCCLVGMQEPSLTISGLELTTRARSLVGTFAYSSAAFESAVQLLDVERDRAAKLVSDVVVLADAPAAFTHLAEANDVAGKILVDLR